MRLTYPENFVQVWTFKRGFKAYFLLLLLFFFFQYQLRLLKWNIVVRTALVSLVVKVAAKIRKVQDPDQSRR